MHRTFRLPLSPLCLAFAGSLFLMSGCLSGGAKYATGPEYMPETHDYLRADTQGAYAECVAMCQQETSLALVTRTGCLDGCAQAANFFPLANRAYASRSECLDGLLDAELDRDRQTGEMRRWCDAKWSHVHNRKGCYIAADAFFTALTPASVCGSDSVAAEAYSASLATAREQAQTSPAPEVSSELPQDTPPPALLGEQSTHQVASAMSPPQETKPAAPEQATEQTEDAGNAPLSTSAPQPVGAGIPPSLAAEQDPTPPTQEETKTPPPAHEKGSASAAMLPAIHDTPKYQQPSATRPPREARQETAEPLPAPTKAEQPEASTTTTGISEAVAPPPSRQEASPAATPPATPSPPAPQVESRPQQDAAVTTMPVPASKEAPIQPALGGMATPAGNSQAAPTASASALPEKTLSNEVLLPKTIEEPAAQPPPSLQQDPAPEPQLATPSTTVRETLSATPPSTARPDTATERPRPKLQLPPIPENPAASAPSSAMMPPVSSMLHQPYSTPAIISPQIDMQPEEVPQQ